MGWGPFKNAMIVTMSGRTSHWKYLTYEKHIQSQKWQYQGFIRSKAKCSEPESLKNTLSAFIPQSFGDHKLLGLVHVRREKGKYKHKCLPYGKYLVGETLGKALDHVISDVVGKYTRDDMLEKLSGLQSTNANENMNQITSGRHQKKFTMVDLRV